MSIELSLELISYLQIIVQIRVEKTCKHQLGRPFLFANNFTGKLHVLLQFLGDCIKFSAFCMNFYAICMIVQAICMNFQAIRSIFTQFFGQFLSISIDFTHFYRFSSISYRYLSIFHRICQNHYVYVLANIFMQNYPGWKHFATFSNSGLDYLVGS